MDDYPLVNEIDAKRAASKLPLLILEIVRRTDEGGNTSRAEMFLQKNKFVRERSPRVGLCFDFGFSQVNICDHGRASRRQKLSFCGWMRC